MAAAQLFHTHTQSLNTKSEFPICLAQCHWLFLSLAIYRYLSFWVVVYCITLKEDCNLFAFALNRIASFMGENLPRKSIQLHQIVCGLTKRTGKRRRERKKNKRGRNDYFVKKVTTSERSGLHGKPKTKLSSYL